MNPDRSRIRTRSPRFAAVLMPLALVVSSEARAQAAGAEGSRTLAGPREPVTPVEEPPFSAPDQTPASISPDEKKTEAVPVPSLTGSPPSVWPWPVVLVACAAAVEVLGAAFAAGGYLTVTSAEGDLEKTRPNANTWGCRGASGACARAEEAYSSALTADAIGNLGFAVSTAVASGLLSVGLIGWKWSAPVAPVTSAGVQVRVAPAPGGMVLRGTF